jgi:hypothetical protein
MLGAFAIDVRPAQSDVAQHAVVELPKQAAASHPFPPTREESEQVRR